MIGYLQKVKINVSNARRKRPKVIKSFSIRKAEKQLLFFDEPIDRRRSAEVRAEVKRTFSLKRRMGYVTVKIERDSRMIVIESG